MQKMQVEEWLRQADKLIREGRYLAADEYLQKVFAVQPHNETAFNYQGRLDFLVKQLSHRVGLTKELQSELRKYRDLHLQRKFHEVTSLLMSAQKMIEDGYAQKASEFAHRALSLDQGNAYARELVHRTKELLSEVDQNSEQELQFRSLLKESWQHGVPTNQQRNVLLSMKESLRIDDERAIELERETKNSLYKQALREQWMTGGISSFTNEIIDALREKFMVSRFDHSFIETELLREVRKDRVKGTILIVDEDEANLLHLARVLRSNFYAVIAAGSYQEALSTIKIISPDVILSEVKFHNGMLGFDLYEHVRSRQALKTTPFLFMTASLDRTTHLISKRFGVDEFFVKPVDTELLFATFTGLQLRKAALSAQKSTLSS
jgi:two-component system chemotaxis response regulator CheY